MRRATMIVAVLVLVVTANAQTHAPWPTDWNNWNDPALWVTVGDPGNVGDTRYPKSGVNSVGGVGYIYNLAKFEVTAGQYAVFLNAVAKTDTYGLYHAAMDAAVYDNVYGGYFGCNIKRDGSSGSYTYSVPSDYANRPVNYVTWADTVRFANWLTNGRPTGDQNLFTTEDGSYHLNGATTDAALMAVTRKANARYVIPTEDEWYKAAYYKGGGTNAGYWNYPTETDAAPGRNLADALANNANYRVSDGAYPIDSGKYTTLAGEFENSGSPYGTFDQGGNLWELNETIINSSYRGLAGGSFYQDVSDLLAARRHYDLPTRGYFNRGFRIAQVPEPASMAVLALGGLVILQKRRK